MSKKFSVKDLRGAKVAPIINEHFDGEEPYVVVTLHFWWRGGYFSTRLTYEILQRPDPDKMDFYLKLVSFESDLPLSPAARQEVISTAINALHRGRLVGTDTIQRFREHRAHQLKKLLALLDRQDEIEKELQEEEDLFDLPPIGGRGRKKTLNG